MLQILSCFRQERRKRSGSGIHELRIICAWAEKGNYDPMYLSQKRMQKWSGFTYLLGVLDISCFFIPLDTWAYLRFCKVAFNMTNASPLVRWLWLGQIKVTTGANVVNRFDTSPASFPLKKRKITQFDGHERKRVQREPLWRKEKYSSVESSLPQS